MDEQKREAAIDIMMMTDRMHRHILDSIGRSCGMNRTQHFILATLIRHGTCPTQKELAEHQSVSPAAVTGALKKLEAEGFVRRTVGADNRNNEITVTDKGREELERNRQAFRAADRRLFHGFSEEELDTYIRLLLKMQENMKQNSEEEEKWL